MSQDEDEHELTTIYITNSCNVMWIFEDVWYNCVEESIEKWFEENRIEHVVKDLLCDCHWTDFREETDEIHVKTPTGGWLGSPELGRQGDDLVQDEDEDKAHQQEPTPESTPESPDYPESPKSPESPDVPYYPGAGILRDLMREVQGIKISLACLVRANSSPPDLRYGNYNSPPDQPTPESTPDLEDDGF
jgi:alpha-glucosidase (family GH31 glycosyl hydrolase)